MVQSGNFARRAQTGFNLSLLAYLTECSALPDGPLLELAQRIEFAVGKAFLLGRWQSESGLRKAQDLIWECSGKLAGSPERRKLLDRSLLRDPSASTPDKSSYAWLQRECHIPMPRELHPGLCWRMLVFPFWPSRHTPNQHTTAIMAVALEPVSQTLLFRWTPIQAKPTESEQATSSIEDLKDRDFFKEILNPINKLSLLGIDQRIEVMFEQCNLLTPCIPAALQSEIEKIPNLQLISVLQKDRVVAAARAQAEIDKTSESSTARAPSAQKITTPILWRSLLAPRQLAAIQNRINATVSETYEGNPNLYVNGMENLRASPVGRLALMILQIQGKGDMPYPEQRAMLKTVWNIVRAGEARFLPGIWAHSYDKL